MGILEFGLLFTSHSTTTASSRSGARLAATSYSQAGSSVAVQNSAAEQIAMATAADLEVLNNAVPVGMIIYRVDTASTNGSPSGGFPGDAMAGGCSSRCIKFTWNAAQQKMDRVSGSWVDADACGLTVDSIGVWVQTKHSFITGLFGSESYVGGHTVMRLEPLPTEQCSGENPG